MAGSWYELAVLQTLSPPCPCPRRHRPAQESLLKEAMRMPRTAGKSKIKNAKMDSLLGKVGRIYMPQQEPEKMATKKMKGVKRQRCVDIYASRAAGTVRSRRACDSSGGWQCRPSPGVPN